MHFSCDRHTNHCFYPPMPSLSNATRLSVKLFQWHLFHKAVVILELSAVWWRGGGWGGDLYERRCWAVTGSNSKGSMKLCLATALIVFAKSILNSLYVYSFFQLIWGGNTFCPQSVRKQSTCVLLCSVNKICWLIKTYASVFLMGCCCDHCGGGRIVDLVLQKGNNEFTNTMIMISTNGLTLFITSAACVNS